MADARRKRNTTVQSIVMSRKIGPIRFGAPGTTYMPSSRQILFPNRLPGIKYSVACSAMAIMGGDTRKALARRNSNTLEAEFFVVTLNDASQKFGLAGIINTDRDSQITSFA